MKPQGYVPPEASPSAREGADLHIGNVVRVAALLAVAIVVCVLILVLFFRHLEKIYPGRTSEAAPVVLNNQLPPAPRLQTNPLRDLQEVRAVEDSHLDRYAWIDRQHGIAQIPIDRAMILWTKSHPMTEPAASTNAAPATGTTELQMRQEKATEVPHGP